MAYIIENGKRLTYVFEGEKVIFSDGKEAIPSIDNIDVKKAYSLAELPGVKPPIIEPPVIIIPPSDGVREISYRDFCGLSDIEGEKFKVKPGHYNDVAWLTNLKNVSIDISDVLISGNNGLYPIELKGKCDNLTIYGGGTGGLKDVNNSCISYQYEGKYDGTDKTVSRGIKLIGLIADNISGKLFQSSGHMRKSDGITGIIADLIISSCEIFNSPYMGTAVYGGLFDNFIFENNIINNVNMLNNNHNGILSFSGTGIVKGNKLTNHQGNLVRCFPVKVLDTTQSIFENNIIYNSRKYGAFEVQSYSEHIESGFFKPVDVIIRNNTAGRLNTLKEWDAKLVDVYDTFGSVSIGNNLGFDLVQARGGEITSLANTMHTPKNTTVIESNNKYFATANEAVVDTINFKSKVKGVGAQ